MQITKSIALLMVVLFAAPGIGADKDAKSSRPKPVKAKKAAVEKKPISNPTPAQRLLKKIPAVSLAKMPLIRVLKHYEKLSGLTIQADWNAMGNIGIKKNTPVTLKASKIRFDKLLDLTLNSIAPKGHPLSWYRDRKIVKVSTQMRVLLRNRISLLPFKEVRTRTRTRTRTVPGRKRKLNLREINFPQMALKNVIAFLRDASGENFHVNWRALETTGITRDTPVTVKAKNLSIARTLDLVTDQLNAGRDHYSSVYWLVQGGIVKISTGEALDKTISVRTYEIGDLLTIIPNFKGPRIGIRPGDKSNNNNNNNGWGDDDDDDDDDDEDNPKEQRKKIRKTLIEIVKFSIGEDMWVPTGKGSIKILRNKMIISQTPLGFKLLEKSLIR
jgi:hypothetical protein